MDIVFVIFGPLRRTNGLGAVNMSLPFEYIQMPSSGSSDIDLSLASAEMLSLQDGQVCFKYELQIVLLCSDSV